MSKKNEPTSEQTKTLDLDRTVELPRKIIVLRWEDQVRKFHKDRLVIGSVVSADLRLSGEEVAPLHAVIELSEKAVTGLAEATLFDLASDSGVKVNGKKVVTQSLKPKDKIQIGEITIEFLLEEIVEGDVDPHMVLTGGQKLFMDPNEDQGALLLQSPEGIEEIFDYRPSQRSALEVVMSWRGTILNVEHFVRKKDVTVGESRDSDFAIPPLLGRKPFRIVTRSGEGFTLHLDEAMSGVVQTQGTLRQVSDLRERTQKLQGTLDIPLGLKDFAKISLGEVDFYFSYTAAPPRLIKKRFFEKDPYFFGIFSLSILLNGFLILLLTQIPVSEDLEAEKIPERVATILYHPEKYTYPARLQQREKQKQTETRDAKAKPISEPKPRKTVQIEIKPSEKPPKEQKVISTGQEGKVTQGTSDSQQKKGAQGQQEAKEGKGAKAKGESGIRGTQKATTEGTPQNKAQRPSAQGGQGAGGGKSEVPGPGNLDYLKGATKEFLDLLGGSTQQLGKGGKGLKGFGAFDTRGGGGQALSGTGAGGGGTSTTSQGLADSGMGGGRVGTGLGAVGQGNNIVGGQVRVDLRRGGPEESVIMGAIDKDAVEAALLAHRDEFRLCYEKEINQGSPNISGRVTTSFVIGPAGRVTQSGIASTTLNNPSTEKCVTRVISRIQFPIPMGGGVVQVKYPFKFRPVER